MKFLLLGIGLLAAIFLLPIFKNLYDAVILPITADITNPFLQVIFIIIPYAVPLAVVIAAFLIIRRRES